MCIFWFCFIQKKSQFIQTKTALQFESMTKISYSFLRGLIPMKDLNGLVLVQIY